MAESRPKEPLFAPFVAENMVKCKERLESPGSKRFRKVSKQSTGATVSMPQWNSSKERSPSLGLSHVFLLF